MAKLNFKRLLFAISLISLIFTGLSGCVVYESDYPGYYRYGYYRPYYYRPYYYGHYYSHRWD